MPLPAGVGEDRGRLAEADARHDRLVDVDVGPRVVEIGHDHDRRARRDDLADVRQLLGDDAGDRRRERWRRRGSARAWRSARRRRPAARGPRRSPRGRAPALQAREVLGGRADALLRRPPARSRATSRPGRRIVALLLREPEFGLEQRLEALEVRLGGRELRLAPPRRRPSALATCASAWRMSSTRGAGHAAAAAGHRPGARSARARRMASATSAVSSTAMRSPVFTRSPSVTLSSSSRPPTWGATCTSVASTWPDARTWLAGGLGGRRRPARQGQGRQEKGEHL